MIQQVVKNEELLRHQSQLPEELRQSCVLICFAEPINATLIQEFLCIRLTDLMSGKGEQSYYLVNRFQPTRTGTRTCPTCRQLMVQLSDNEFHCQNNLCEFSTKTMIAGPRSGIVNVKYPSDAVVRTDDKFEYIDKCVIVLDRRYDESVLAGVFRTANQIAEERGWKVL